MARPPLPLGTWGVFTTVELDVERWRARASYRDYDGVTRVVARFGASKGKAESALRKALRDRQRAGQGDEVTAETTMRVLAELWLARCEQEGKKSTRTLAQYRGAVNRTLNPAIGGVRVREATVGTLDRFLRDVQAPSAARMCRTILSQMMALAAQHDAVEHNPVRDTATRSTPKKEVRALTEEDLAQIRARVQAWIGGNRMGPPRAYDLAELVEVQLGTGTRIGELLGLLWQDVDLEADPPTVAITGQVVQEPGVGAVRVPYTKTQAGLRTLTLPQFAANALARQLERGLPSEQGLVFPSTKGTPRSPSNVRRQVREARGEDYKWFVPHTLRKTSATTISRHFTVGAATAQLGHSGERVTTAHYVQRSSHAPDVRTALDTLAPVSGELTVSKGRRDGNRPDLKAV